MGVNGRAWAAEHLPWGVVAAQMAHAYEETVRDHRTYQQGHAKVAVVP
jgi:hypothetical protein